MPRKFNTIKKTVEKNNLTWKRKMYIGCLVVQLQDQKKKRGNMNALCNKKHGRETQCQCCMEYILSCYVFLTVYTNKNI